MTMRRCLLSFVLLGARLACAATIIVNSDSGAANVNAACVLRDAITQANTGNPTGGCGVVTTVPPPRDPMRPDCLCTDNTIVLPANATITLAEVDDATSNTGLPTITASLTIAGNGSVIERDTGLACNQNGAADPGEFALMRSVSPLLVLNHLTLSHGCADSADYQFAKGGAISNVGTLVLQNVVLYANYASNRGGAIYDSGSGIGFGTSTIADSLFVGNTSMTGGAIYAEGAYGTLDIMRSLFVQNAAGQYFGGGAIEAAQDTTVDIVNSTFSANSAGGGSAIEAAGIVSISSSTFADNLAVGGGAAFQISGSGAGQLATIKNSLFAPNGGDSGNCLFNGGVVTIAGMNLSSDSTCAGFALNDTDAKLGPLTDNGGPTPTYALESASPAVDATADCTDADGFAMTTDQRGMPRPYALVDPSQALCDIGAFELGDAIFGDGFDPGASAGPN